MCQCCLLHLQPVTKLLGLSDVASSCSTSHYDHAPCKQKQDCEFPLELAPNAQQCPWIWHSLFLELRFQHTQEDTSLKTTMLAPEGFAGVELTAGQ